MFVIRSHAIDMNIFEMIIIQVARADCLQRSSLFHILQRLPMDPLYLELSNKFTHAMIFDSSPQGCQSSDENKIRQLVLADRVTNGSDFKSCKKTKN